MVNQYGYIGGTDIVAGLSHANSAMNETAYSQGLICFSDFVDNESTQRV